MEGESEVIEYDGRADIVKFRQRAQLRRYAGTVLNDTIDGVVIVYDNTTSILAVDGGPAKTGPDGQNQRVRAMLTPRAVESRPANTLPVPAVPAVPASAPALRPSTTLGGTKQ